MTYRVVEDGEHVVAVVQGATLPELFEHVVLAVFDIAYSIGRVRVERDVPVMAVGDSPDHLLDDWLVQVVSASRDHGLVVTTATVDRLEPGGAQGAIGGYRAGRAAVRRFAPDHARVERGIVDTPDGHWARIRID